MSKSLFFPIFAFGLLIAVGVSSQEAVGRPICHEVNQWLPLAMPVTRLGRELSGIAASSNTVCVKQGAYTSSFLFYRRSSSTGQWDYRGELTGATLTPRDHDVIFGVDNSPVFGFLKSQYGYLLLELTEAGSPYPYFYHLQLRP